MCAILDANVLGLVFGKRRPPAELAFFEWIHAGRGHLVVGGELLRELDHDESFREWREEATLAGRITRMNDEMVDERARRLKEDGACRSDDWHVVALAQLSGARLLYSHDHDLQEDFRDEVLIDGPPGRVYSTEFQKNLTKSHRRLLAATGTVCRRFVDSTPNERMAGRGLRRRVRWPSRK